MLPRNPIYYFVQSAAACYLCSLYLLTICDIHWQVITSLTMLCYVFTNSVNHAQYNKH